MANRTPLNSRSAAPLKMQVQTATNEYLRRMRNTSRELQENHLISILEDYSCDLKRGGYHPNWINTCLEAACTGYGRKVKSEIEGGEPVNRAAHMGARGRRIKALTGKSTWFQGGAKNSDSGSNQNRNPNPNLTTSRKQPNKGRLSPPGKPESIVFVPHTPGGDLRKEVQEEEDRISGSSKFGKVKVIERLGNSLIHSLGNKAPWRNEACGRECVPCQSKPGSCRKRNCTYQILCNICTKEENRSSIYWGETHRTWWDRCQEHLRALDSGDESYATVKHMMIHHPGRQHDFLFKFEKSWKTSLQRQIQEAIRIEETDPGSLMNSKTEFGANSVPRVTIQQHRDQFKKRSADSIPGSQLSSSQNSVNSVSQASRSSEQSAPGFFEQRPSKKHREESLEPSNIQNSTSPKFPMNSCPDRPSVPDPEPLERIKRSAKVSQDQDQVE